MTISTSLPTCAKMSVEATPLKKLSSCSAGSALTLAMTALQVWIAWSAIVRLIIDESQTISHVNASLGTMKMESTIHVGVVKTWRLDVSTAFITLLISRGNLELFDMDASSAMKAISSLT